MSKLTLGDRIASGAVGAVIGAALGLVLLWLLGVYSNTLGPASIHVSVVKWLFSAATIFALVGFVFGPVVGTILGAVISAVFRFERQGELDPPIWLVLVVLGVVAFCVWWSFSNQT